MKIMKNYSLLFSLLFAPLFLFSQNWVTESKSCGSCGKTVPNSSRVGQRCPHCGVTWGRENSTTKKTPYYDYTPSYSNPFNNYPSYTPSISINSFATTRKNTNLRSSTSTKSSIKTVIPADSQVYVMSKKGNWYYVRYSKWYYDWLGRSSFIDYYGYVYYNLLY